MKYDDPELQDRLAGEYVLGTLHGRARRRMQKLLSRNAGLQRLVVAWEERLMPLNDELAPVRPPASVWRALQQRLGVAARQPALGGPEKLWRALAAGFALLSLVLGWLLAEHPFEPGPPTYVSVVPDAEGRALWLLQLREDAAEIHAKAVADIPPQAGKSYELWMLPADGSPPISLGLLPGSGSAESTVPRDKFRALGEAGGLAVSLEPEGGSPTGQPTGPVLYTAPIAPG